MEPEAPKDKIKKKGIGGGGKARGVLFNSTDNPGFSMKVLFGSRETEEIRSKLEEFILQRTHSGCGGARLQAGTDRIRSRERVGH